MVQVILLARLICRKSKRGVSRLETYLSTESAAPGKNARLSHSHENSGRAQCYTAPPSEGPSSLNSLKSSFDLSSFPQDFSAATPKRVSAGLRRRAAPQRLTMHGLSPAQWVTALTPGDHYAGAPGESGVSQSPAAARAGGLPAESHRCSRWLGHSGEPAPASGDGILPRAPARTVAGVSAAASAVSGIVKLLMLGSIRFYQACLSPHMPMGCRFQPSCSAYAFEAVEQWGAWKGGWLAVRRLLRCRPFGKFGFDPVPQRRGLGTGD